ncbi:hypothetical protein ACJJTC_004649, partial [Scirpophaga incertulas]
MAEMASMWQECLQRYRDISSDFDTLKHQVNVAKPQYVSAESPTRLPAAVVACEGEPLPPAPYRLPAHYPQMPVSGGCGGWGGYGGGGSPLRPRASAPAPPGGGPGWWWAEEPRRRSSPESRGGSRSRHDQRRRDDRRPGSRLHVDVGGGVISALFPKGRWSEARHVCYSR